MSLASRISDLTNAVAAAVNARANKVGASAFDIAVINGYTGTQTQWLAQQTANPASGLLPWRLTGNPATVTAGSLVVTVPDGVQLSIGGQVWTASGISTTVPKPASGDQWSLLVLRATWGTDGTMRVAPVLLNITPTSNTTPPTVPPTAFPAFSATYGTQVDVPLTWVWVTATSTVPTIYDASLRYTNLGGFSLANPYILQAYHNAGTNPIRGLGTIGIGQFDTQTLASDGSGTSAIRDSIWMRRGGTSGVIWKPLGTLRAQVLQGVTDLTGIFNTLGQVRGFSQETECFCEANSFTYRYVGVGATNLGNLDTTSAW